MEILEILFKICILFQNLSKRYVTMITSPKWEEMTQTLYAHMNKRKKEREMLKLLLLKSTAS
jgi:DNA-binding transcriptional regulator/RsmH inhibitor MraZ